MRVSDRDIERASGAQHTKTCRRARTAVRRSSASGVLKSGVAPAVSAAAINHFALMASPIRSVTCACHVRPSNCSRSNKSSCASRMQGCFTGFPAIRRARPLTNRTKAVSLASSVSISPNSGMTSINGTGVSSLVRISTWICDSRSSAPHPSQNAHAAGESTTAGTLASRAAAPNVEDCVT